MLSTKVFTADYLTVKVDDQFCVVSDKYLNVDFANYDGEDINAIETISGNGHQDVKCDQKNKLNQEFWGNDFASLLFVGSKGRVATTVVVAKPDDGILKKDELKMTLKRF